MSSIAFVGMDVHAETICVSVLSGTSDQELDQRTINSDEASVRRYFQKLKERLSKGALPCELRCCYEASGCGYVLHGWLKSMGVACDVIAPSLVPIRAGDRVKTDKRDARKLARLHKAGELTSVHVPTQQEEAARGLVRCRDTMVREVVASKNYVLKFLRLRGVIFREGKTHWTDKHWRWLRGLRFEGADAAVYLEYMSLLEYKRARLVDLDAQVEALAQTSEYKEAVGRLCCFRGIGVLSAMVILTETLDFARFGSAKALMSYYGVVPTEHSSGGSRVRGAITKAGNSRCRRILVEAAWQYQHPPARGSMLSKRQVGQPASVVAHAWKAQHRLHKKFYRIACRKERNKAVVAVARELVGFLWATMNPTAAAKMVADANNTATSPKAGPAATSPKAGPAAVNMKASHSGESNRLKERKRTGLRAPGRPAAMEATPKHHVTLQEASNAPAAMEATPKHHVMLQEAGNAPAA